jgi:hypothetical protein
VNYYCWSCATRKKISPIWMSNAEARMHSDANPHHRLIDEVGDSMQRDLPPRFYGRRKNDPKPVYRKPDLFDRGPVIVGVILVVVCAAMLFFSGCVSYRTHRIAVAEAELKQSIKCWDSVENIAREYERKICEMKSQKGESK